MPCRPAFAALAASLVLVGGAVGCGSSGTGPTGFVGAPPPRIGVVVVDPKSGPVGTLFTLSAGGLRQDETVAFEITFPGEGKAFPGAALTVPPDGTATTTYRATTANQPGDYLVRVTGAPGTLAEGRFTVTDGPPVTSAPPEVPGFTSTSGRTATTARTGRTTTSTPKSGSTTATSARAAVTTSTTRKVVQSTVTTTARTVPLRP